MLDFVAPEFRRAISRFRKGVREHGRYQMDCKIDTACAEERWLECTGRMIVLHGSPAMLLSFRDITERVQAEKALRESEYKFATVFRSNPVPLTLTSGSDGVFIDVNDAFLRSSGYTREELIGKTACEMGFFVDDDENALFVSKLRAEQTVHGMELRCRNKAGEIRTCRFSSRIVPIGGMPHILTTIEDITEYKKAQEAIRESGERYRLILENAHEGVLINELTPRGPGSSSTSTRIGLPDPWYDAGGDLGVSLVDLDTPEMQRRAPGYVQDLIRNQHAVFQTHYRTRDNQEKIIDISTSLLDLDGQQATISVVRDITEQRAAESALHALVAGMVGATGMESLDRIAESLSAWLGADCVMIGEIAPDGGRVGCSPCSLTARRSRTTPIS